MLSVTSLPQALIELVVDYCSWAGAFCYRRNEDPAPYYSSFPYQLALGREGTAYITESLVRRVSVHSAVRRGPDTFISLQSSAVSRGLDTFIPLQISANDQWVAVAGSEDVYRVHWFTADLKPTPHGSLVLPSSLVRICPRLSDRHYLVVWHESRLWVFDRRGHLLFTWESHVRIQHMAVWRDHVAILTQQHIIWLDLVTWTRETYPVPRWSPSFYDMAVVGDYEMLGLGPVNWWSLPYPYTHPRVWPHTWKDLYPTSRIRVAEGGTAGSVIMRGYRAGYSFCELWSGQD